MKSVQFWWSFCKLSSIFENALSLCFHKSSYDATLFYKKKFCFQLSVFLLNNQKNFKTNLFEVYFENKGATNKEKPGSIEKI